MINIPEELPEVFSEESFSSLSLLQRAMYLRGLFNSGIIPVVRGEKNPGLKEVKVYHTIKPTIEETIEWFIGHEDKNIGILMCEIYGIVGLDIDDYKPDYDTTFFSDKEMPLTWTTITGAGGRHYFFKRPSGIKLVNKSSLGKHIEFKSQGLILVAPGSTHKNGKKYRWAQGCAPWDIDEPAEMPDWLIEMVREKPRAVINTEVPTKKKDWGKFLSEIHTEGERNNTLASVAGRVFLDMPEDKWEDTAIPFLIDYNKTKLIPPLPDDEAHRTIRSIMSIEKRRRTEEAFTDVIDNIASNGKKKLSDKVFTLLQEKTELIRDQDGNLFLVDLADPRKKLYPMDSEDLLDFITHTYYTEFKSTIGQDVVKNIAANLRAHAKHSGKKRTTYIRVGYDKSKNAIYYDLNNPAGEMVKITEDNMEIVPQGEILFRRFQNMDEQIRPKNTTKDAQIILKYFNINTEEDKHLFLVYVIALFLSHIDMPILVLNGQAGAGKSTFFRFVKEIIDPPTQKKLTGYSFPNKQKDLEIQLTRGYFHTYDNLSEIKKDVSDIFCQVVTGGGYSTKKNYADEEMIDRTFVVRLGIGSIDKIIWYKDLIERSLMLNLETLKKGINADKILEDFTTDKPEILDFIFCTLALSLGDTDEIIGLPRLGDFGKWGEKISRALGYEKNLFLHRYREKLERQHKDINREIIPPWVMSLVDFVVSPSGTWEDEPTKLFSIATNTMKLKTAPDNLVGFCKTFYKYIPHLKTLGIEIIRDASGKRSITITKRISDSEDKSDSLDSLDDISEAKWGNNTE